MNYQLFHFEVEPFEFESDFDETMFEGFDTELADQEWEGEVKRNSPEYIRWVQQSLNRIMGLRLPVDGALGLVTRSAIRSFQQKHGLAANGIAGPETKRALIAAQRHSPVEPDRTPFGSERLGREFEMQGEECRGFEIDPIPYIKWVQRSLNRILDSKLVVDGKKDSEKYQAAVREFQSWHGFQQTGLVDEKTQDKLILANKEDAAYITWVQQALNKHGAGLVPDGTAGTNTKNAIQSFQSERVPDLCDDGFVGAKTELRLIQAGGGLPPGHIEPVKPPTEDPDKPDGPKPKSPTPPTIPTVEPRLMREHEFTDTERAFARKAWKQAVKYVYHTRWFINYIAGHDRATRIRLWNGQASFPGNYNSGVPRVWFGDYDDVRFGNVLYAVNRIWEKFRQSPWKMKRQDCIVSASKGVPPSAHVIVVGQVRLCDDFFGNLSAAALPEATITLVHEMSHHIWIKSPLRQLKDRHVAPIPECHGPCYGEANAKMLANRYPKHAVANSENYALFIQHYGSQLPGG